jgi:glycosyltransferase involved in cell wall biosynthesis
MNKTPNMLSVALCTYNGENFIEKQLESILKQTIPVNEIIICDDCSSDNTIAILEKYKTNYPTLFKIYRNDVNLRSNKNFEKAIALSSGDYIFLSDQDDIWKSDKVEKTLAIFEENPNAEGVFSNADFIDENDNTIFEKLSLWEFVCLFENKIYNPNNLLTMLLFKGNYLTGATLCLKKATKDFCLPFQTGDDFIHDEWLALQLANRKTLYYSTEYLISYRIHKSQQLGIGSIADSSRLLKENFNSYNLILENKKASSFKDYKIKTRAFYFQYDKYKKLYLEHKNPLFLDIKNKLLEKYLEEDKKMKQWNPILYFLRKLKDKRKGKRQLIE